MDEKTNHRGHKYETIVSDSERGVVLDVGLGHDKNSVKAPLLGLLENLEGAIQTTMIPPAPIQELDRRYYIFRTSFCLFVDHFLHQFYPLPDSFLGDCQRYQVRLGGTRFHFYSFLGACTQEPSGTRLSRARPFLANKNSGIDVML